MSASGVIGQSEAAASESAAPGKHIPGEPGIWVLLFGDMLVFTVLFVVYLSRRREHHEPFAAS